MIGAGIREGRRPSPVQWVGVALALAGLALLARPGRGGGDAAGAALMDRGRDRLGRLLAARPRRGRPGARQRRELRARRGARQGGRRRRRLVRVAPGIATAPGLALAVASGALASAGGYSLWYAAIPALGPTRAAAVQLSVPVLTAMAGVALLGEPASARAALAGAAILAGIALALRERRATDGR